MAKKKKLKFRIDIIALIAIFILIIVFCAYMMNTSVIEVVESECGTEVITHENNYEY
ncbi:MAG: hypothetical protein ACI4I7_02930 [Oscillospiraceae bacterium]